MVVESDEVSTLNKEDQESLNDTTEGAELADDIKTVEEVIVKEIKLTEEP
jgi:hypothetical protein